jgi:hypothetical protein
VRWTDKLLVVHCPLEVDEPQVEYGPLEVNSLLVVDTDGSLVLDELMLVDGLLMCDELRAVVEPRESHGAHFLVRAPVAMSLDVVPCWREWGWLVHLL